MKLNNLLLAGFLFILVVFFVGLSSSEATVEFETTGSIHLLEPSEFCYNFVSCSDYNETLCGEDPCNLSFGAECGGYRLNICTYLPDHVSNRTSCKCFWDEGVCKHSEDVVGVITIEGYEVHWCVKTSIPTECIDGKLILNITGNTTWNGTILDKYAVNGVTVNMIKESCGDICPSELREVNCGSALLRLSFFGFVGVICVFVILTIFYFYYVKKTKHRTKKNKV